MDEERFPAPLPPGGQMLIYRDGAATLQVRLDGQTVWLTQAAMAELFQTTPQNITLHLQSIYDDAYVYSPKGLNKIAQGCRFGGYPGVATPTIMPTLKGLRNFATPLRNPVGVLLSRLFSPQGSRCAATLGCPAQSLRDNRHLEAEQPTSDFDRAVEKLTDQRPEVAKPKRRAKQSGKRPTEGEV